jgi:hypothetical protein
LKFCEKIQDIHWVDGHRFPTNPQVIEVAFKFLWREKVKIFLHSTPRQLEDNNRKWIREEYERFVAELQKIDLGNDIT